MKKVKLDNVKAEHFIGSWNIEDNDLCSEIIKFFENNQELQKVGSTSSGVDFSVKKLQI